MPNRKTQVRELKESERHLRVLAASIPQMLWTATPEGQLNYLSDQGLRYLGIGEELLYGEKWLNAVHQDDRESAIRSWTHAIATSTPYETSYRLRRFDGTWRWHLVRGVPVVGDDAKVSQWYGTCTDIEDQKQAETLMQQDRQRWQELLQRAPAAIAIFHGPAHIFEWVNSDFVRMVGRSDAAKLLGKPAREGLPELVAQGYIDLLDRVFAAGQPHAEQEAPVLLGEGGDAHEAYVNFVCMPTRDTQGRVDGNFVHATDVSDLVKARKQVEESERQFRTLAETIPHLAWMAHADGFIFWYNQRWYDYTGTTLESVKGRNWETLHDPDVLPRVLDQWKLSLASGKPFDMIFPLKGANGEFRTFLTRVEPVKDNGGRVVRWFGTNTDVTEQKRTEEELRRANRDLEEFTYVASHDLQEPLRMVSIYTQLMMKTLGEPEGNLGKYAAVVRQNVARMETLIHDLLKFSRTVHDDRSSSSEPLSTADLAAALAEATTVLRSRIEEVGAVIRAPSSWPVVRGDTDQLAHVFQNLVSNALKYSRPGTKPEIHICAHSDGVQCTISVEDNGIGFEQQHAESIFGLFKRLHRRDAYAGTGLGLAICKRIVERAGGKIWAEGRPDQGSTFYLSLPLAG